MKVLKFGGTSVGTPQRIKDVASLISKRGRNIVVLSAMSGTTNSLLQIVEAIKNGKIDEASEILKSLKGKYDDVIGQLYSKDEYKDKALTKVSEIFSEIEGYLSRPYSARTEKEIVAKGEMISTNLMHLYLMEQGVNASLINALDFMRINASGEPDMEYIAAKLPSLLDKDADLIITQGFICRNADGLTDNLERGGSDYTASILGAVTGAEEVEIWTDIDGMHNNDPRFVEETRPVRNLHFDEAAELAYFGAKILHPTCILPAKLANIPVRLLNTMEPEAEGTLINNELKKGCIKAVAAKDNITAIKIKSGRMLLAYGFLKKVFEVFEKYETAIDMVTTSEVGVSLTIDNEHNLPLILEELEKFGTVSVDRDMVIICVVGDLEWHNRGFEASAMEALRNVPVRMISFGGSNYNITFLINKEDKNKALRLLSYHLF